jgi:hypothetical protein
LNIQLTNGSEIEERREVVKKLGNISVTGVLDGNAENDPAGEGNEAANEIGVDGTDPGNGSEIEERREFIKKLGNISALDGSAEGHPAGEGNEAGNETGVEGTDTGNGSD